MSTTRHMVRDMSHVAKTKMQKETIECHLLSAHALHKFTFPLHREVRV